jgi:intracellular sulfur oxidation DsrE/DsrF family protein
VYYSVSPLLVKFTAFAVVAGSFATICLSFYFRRDLKSGSICNFTTTEPGESIGAESQEALASLASTTAELKELGVRMEVCSAATKHFEVDNASLLPVMDVVGNGFISLIGWQSKGYVSMTF